MSRWRRIPWPRVASGAAVLALYGLAVALRWPFTDAGAAGIPAYGDEGLHYWTARAFTQPPPTVTDVEGAAWLHPGWIFWQRPAYYLALHPFALGGFEAFRAGHILLSSLLPVAAWALVRSRGGHWLGAAAAGLACAALPSLVTWGALAMMDEPMAVALAFALAARWSGRHALASVLFLLAVWTKETAYLLVAGLAVASFARAWWRSEATLHPLRLDGATGSCVLPLALGPVPLFVGLTSGLDQFGSWASSNYSAHLADWLYVTPWFVPVLAVGLAWPASRPSCAFALAFATAYLLSHAWGGRTVEAWYVAGTAVFVLAGVTLALEQALRRASRPAAKAGAAAAMAGALLLVGAAVLAPAGAAKGAWTHPFAGHPEDSLDGMLRYQRGARDAAWREAVARMGLDGTQDVVTVDVDYADALALAEAPPQARHVHVDLAWFRDVVPLWFDGFVARAEANGTWLLVAKSDRAFYHAVNEAYVDCRVLENAEFRLYEAWRCPGGKDELERGFASRRP